MKGGKVMKRILRVMKKHWIVIWLAVALLAFGVFVTYAAYTEVSSVKRVVSTQASPGEMFSSNCMRPDISIRKLSSSVYTVTVCNYDQDKPTMYNPSTITYTLHAELQVKRGDTYYTMPQLESALNDPGLYGSYVDKAANYSIYKSYDDADPNTPLESSKYGFTSENGYTVSFASDTLASLRSSVDRYTVEINNADTDVYVHVWAVPSEPTSLRKIETRLYGAAASEDTATWTGTMLETDCATVDYDFYNYVITGSGAGTVDILWDPYKFEINPFFFADQQLTPTEIEASDEKYGTDYNGWNKVTLRVNSTVKNRYEMQLYKTPQDSPSGVFYTGENAATKFIVCFFEK